MINKLLVSQEDVRKANNDFFALLTIRNVEDSLRNKVKTDSMTELLASELELARSTIYVEKNDPSPRYKERMTKAIRTISLVSVQLEGQVNDSELKQMYAKELQQAVKVLEQTI